MKYVTGFERRAIERFQEEGMEKAQRETLMLILRHRFAKHGVTESEGAEIEVIFASVSQQINQLKSLPLLTQAINQALTTPSVEAFQRYLAEVIASSTPAATPVTAPATNVEKQGSEKRAKRKRTPAAQP